MQKLLDTRTGNDKIKKTQDNTPGVRLAGLSLMPDDIICPWSNAAKCRELCLKHAGRGKFQHVINSRQKKTDFWHNDELGFLAQLRRELINFEKTCRRAGLQPAVRLNVLSDIQWENYGIPQAFPTIIFYDYTKHARRLGKTPDNYKLIFSYSGAPKYAGQVARAVKTDAPISVVFKYIPTDPSYRFLNRPIINGDQSDLANVNAGRVIVGLTYKNAGADAETVAASDFVVDPDLIARAA
jgi:hypothetical protein